MKNRSKASTSNLKISELAQHLRREHLFVTSERNLLQKLNSKVLRTSERLYHLNWIVRQHRLIVERAFLHQSSESEAASLCCTAAALDTTTFIDSYKKLGSKESLYSNLLNGLRQNPKLVAQILSRTADPEICTIIVCDVYGDCLTPEDRLLLLQVIRELIVIQVATSDQPRRLIRHGSCAFSRVLKMYQETLPASKLFLTSALREAVISVLVEDDLYLDIDVERAVVRFPVEERLRHFGKEGTKEYKEKIEMYKSWATEKLETLVSKFLQGIQKSMFCFPEHLSYIITEKHRLLSMTNRFTEQEIGAICSDLTFNQFICHAIMYPELYGIVDMHITAIARFNLMQVAQIVQVLAMSRFENMDSRFRDVCGRFEKENVMLSGVVNKLIQNEAETYESLIENLTYNMKDVKRACVFITEQQLHKLTNFLHDVRIGAQDHDIGKQLDSLLRNLPRVVQDVEPIEQSLNEEQETDRKKSILNRVKSIKLSNEPTNDVQVETSTKEVLVVPIDNNSDHVLPGMLSEEKVLELEVKKRHVKVRMSVDGTLLNEETESIISGSASEKRTRFSQDQESIGTSDNLEAISEGASTHSAEPSIESESENENDNLSDMVSANVSSGRGTPNVSGRDTSSSNTSSDEENDAPNVVNEEQSTPQVQRTNQQQTLNTIPIEPLARSGTRTHDIEEKFGKFDCKPSVSGVAVDETKSMLSDTWSTDVLGSDCEALIQHDPSLVHAAINAQVANMNQAYASATISASAPEESETASQSDAWSTDVLTSDTERLREFDPEDQSLPIGDIADGDELCHRNYDESDEIGNTELDTIRKSSSRTASSESDAGTQLDSLTMQTLGRISFDIRQKKKDTNDAVDLLCSLKGSSNPSKSDAQRASITELLSLELTEDSQTILPAKLTSEEPFSLIDFEREIAAADRDSSNNLIDLPNDDISSSTDGHRVKTDSGISFTDSVGGDFPVPNGEIVSDGPKKPAVFTGAIPKTINFRSKIAVSGPHRVSRNQSESDDKRRGGFFKLSSNLKKNFQEKMKSLSKRGSTNSAGDALPPDRGDALILDLKESSDDILNKYKQKEGPGDMAGASDALLVDVLKRPDSESYTDSKPCTIASTKRKLRRVLSLVDVYGLPISCIQSDSVSGPDAHSELIKFLRLLLAEAKHLANSIQIVAVQETIRCVESLDEKSCQQIFWTLQEDYQRRSSFISYLLKSKQSLLSIEAHLEAQSDYLFQEKTICLHNLIYICVKQYLERKEKAVAHFIRCFQRLSTPDEKVQVVEKFLHYLYQTMEKDSLWQTVSEYLMDYGREVIERCVMSQIYMFALYPNGDGDVLRDQILHQHISKLSQSLTLHHKDLRIPTTYHSEAPWLSAQEEIATINAFKTPKEKVQCVVRTCTIIMSLLSLASDSSVPAADDLMPVLVFVVVKANPPSLLSTVQYVSSFYESHFEGEEAYWWTQFSSAIEFIKTMDY